MTTNWPLSEEGFATVPGGRIWYGIAGQRGHGGTPLLVIHGGPGMSHHYLFPLTELAEERPVVFYDQLDAGSSDRPNDPTNWTIPRFLEEIDALRNLLGLDQVLVFGNSWGGTLAAAYAAMRPPGLRKLVLSSPLISTRRWIAGTCALRDGLPDDVKRIMEACEARGDTDAPEYQDAVDMFYGRHFCRIDPWPDYVQATFEALNETCYVGMWGSNEFTCTGILRDYDGADELASINVPTLVTCGEFDEAMPAACKEFANMIPNARYAEFADTSHLAFVEDGETYFTAIRRFLAA